MKSFWEMLQLIEEPLPGAGMPPGGAPMPGGPPMGGMPPMGGPPMGGAGMPPMGGPPMPGAPMDGGMGAPEPTKQLKPGSVWSVLSKLLDGKHIEKPKKDSGQPAGNMIQPPQQLPPDPSQQGMSPSGPMPPAQPPMM